jgi:hypothetical protein
MRSMKCRKRGLTPSASRLGSGDAPTVSSLVSSLLVSTVLHCTSCLLYDWEQRGRTGVISTTPGLDAGPQDP